jgi:hypothetical protein
VTVNGACGRAGVNNKLVEETITMLIAMKQQNYENGTSVNAFTYAARLPDHKVRRPYQIKGGQHELFGPVPTGVSSKRRFQLTQIV